MNLPLCFVLMPFGKKPDTSRVQIDFDAVYQLLLEPAIKEAGLEPLRADEEKTGGIIHKPMFERLLLCEYAVADLTTANANVFYELGVRHAVRPYTTVPVFAKGKGRLPFDIAPLRALPYSLGKDGRPENIDVTKSALVEKLKSARGAAVDSPVYQLVENFPHIDHTKTDVFRDRVDYSLKMKERLARARKEGKEELQLIESSLGPIEDTESGVLIDLFLSYRAVSAWERMVALTEKMPKPLAATVMVQEQLALALNRWGRGEEAEKVLNNLIDEKGPSSETYGILGRVYKDRWERALKNNEVFLAKGLLDKAIEAYLKGFEADWRDAYPGVNAVTLMEIKDPPDERRGRLIPVVAYAVERRIASGAPDYWDYATVLELAVLAKDKKRAEKALEQALERLREPWEAETTVRNLRLIHESRHRRQESIAWADAIEEELNKKAER